MTFRRLVALLAVPFAVSACDSPPTASAPSDEASFEAVLETAGEGASAGMYLERAPEAVRLTPEQRKAIREINQAFRAANQADLRTLEGLTRAALAARRNGASPAEIRAILEEGRDARERLVPAFQELHRQIRAVLTDAQLKWLKDNSRRFGPQLPHLPRRP